MTQQPTLPWFQERERAHARQADPDTSHAAAASVSRITETKRTLLDLLHAYGPMTHEQLIDAWRVTVNGPMASVTDQSIRSRCAELVRTGHVKACGEGVTASGRRTKIWTRAAPAP